MSTTKPIFTYRLSIIALILAVMASLVGAAFQPAEAAVALSIVSVEQGKSVTIRVEGMPANKEFRVLMNKINTQGVDGTVAGTAKTGSNGSFTETFPIPASLKNDGRIAIRVEATDRSGFYAYNWFVNSTSTSGSSTGGSTSGTGSVPVAGDVTGSGNLTIVEVEEDKLVSISAKNLAANSTYSVWFDWKNRSGVMKGVRAGSVTTDKNGAVEADIKLPVGLQDRQQIRMRLVAANGTGAAYIWFLNADSDDDMGGGSPAGSGQGIPYILIESVVEGDEVTIVARNFPENMKFDVYMGKIGTQGKDGEFVKTVKSPKKGNSFTVTLDIPKKLKNREKIAIRLVGADNDDYYAYNWFENETKP